MLKEIIENRAELTYHQVKHINDVVLGNNMPWYFSQDSVYKDNISYFSHVLIHRKEENKNVENNSPLTDFFIEIFNKEMNKNKIEVNEILRASLNATFYHDRKYGSIHVDHSFEHKNFIMYLNTIDNAGTAVFDNDINNPIYISECVKFQYVVFPGLEHAQMYPPPGSRRAVFVVTFR